jgi:hypothetical protein
LKKRPLIDRKNVHSSTDHRPNLWRVPMAEASSTANNGVNVAALIAAREALTKAPAASPV